ncbi:MAG: nucleotidyltransferase family protein, partial [Conexivisphaera sp.]
MVLVLAGGLGTRLRPVIGDSVPKPMADVNGRPFLER